MLIQNGCVLHYNRLETDKDLRIQAGTITEIGEKVMPDAGVWDPRAGDLP